MGIFTEGWDTLRWWLENDQCPWCNERVDRHDVVQYQGCIFAYFFTNEGWEMRKQRGEG